MTLEEANNSVCLLIEPTVFVQRWMCIGLKSPVLESSWRKGGHKGGRIALGEKKKKRSHVRVWLILAHPTWRSASSYPFSFPRRPRWKQALHGNDSFWVDEKADRMLLTLPCEIWVVNVTAAQLRANSGRSNAECKHSLPPHINIFST